MSESQDGERTTVPAIPADQVPDPWQPTLRLLGQLVEIFGNESVIEIDEVAVADAPEEAPA